MRKTRIVSVALLAASGCISAVFAGETGVLGTSGKTVVYLDGATLALLRTTNPRHYEKAQRIIAAANELCRPGDQRMQFVRYDAKDLSCSRYLLKTSNPPKRQIGFTLDDTRYVALVTVTDDQAKPVELLR